MIAIAVAAAPWALTYGPAIGFPEARFLHDELIGTQAISAPEATIIIVKDQWGYQYNPPVYGDAAVLLAILIKPSYWSSEYAILFPLDDILYNAIGSIMLTTFIQPYASYSHLTYMVV